MSCSVLLSCEAISKAYGAQSLFTGLSLGLSEGDRVGLVGPNGSSSDRQSKKLLVAQNLVKAFGPKPILNGVDLTLTSGMRLGLLGPNGSGKTTLLRLLAAMETPDDSEIERAADLRVVYFEQNRAALDPDLSLGRALAPEGDTVIYGDRPIQVVSWAKRFLFRADQLALPVHRLRVGVIKRSAPV